MQVALGGTVTELVTMDPERQWVADACRAEKAHRVQFLAGGLKDSDPDLKGRAKAYSGGVTLPDVETRRHLRRKAATFAPLNRAISRNEEV